MTTRHEDLVASIAAVLQELPECSDETAARMVVAEIYRQAVKWPTDAMLAGCRAEWQKRLRDKVRTGTIGRDVDEPFRENWHNMLAASPIAPSDEK